MKILVINPGSTSTKIAVFDGENSIFEKTIRHNSGDITNYSKIVDQFEFRVNLILKELEANNFNISDFNAISARGGLLHPIESGTYRVNDSMVKDLLESRYGEHASNLGAIIAKNLSDKYGIPAFIVDPVVVDEMKPIAKYSGLKGVERKPRWHALNQKAIARLVASDLGKKYEELNLIIAHLGGGISVAAHEKGKVVDVNNALNGDGPFAPERAGGLPIVSLLDLCFSHKYTYEEMLKMLSGKGGLVSHLGTNSAMEVEEMINNGDAYAKLVYEAMAYQVAKSIGELSTVLSGNVDAIVLTGGLAKSEMLTNWVKERVLFISRVLIYPGEDEMKALALGVLRVIEGKEEAKSYERV